MMVVCEKIRFLWFDSELVGSLPALLLSPILNLSCALIDAAATMVLLMLAGHIKLDRVADKMQSIKASSGPT